MGSEGLEGSKMGFQGFRLSRDARHPSDNSNVRSCARLSMGCLGIGPEFGQKGTINGSAGCGSRREAKLMFRDVRSCRVLSFFRRPVSDHLRTRVCRIETSKGLDVPTASQAKSRCRPRRCRSTIGNRSNARNVPSPVDPPGRCPYPMRSPVGRTAAVLAHGGKSGLHGDTAPDNVRRGQPQGQRHRKQTARDLRIGQGKGERVR